MKLNINFTSKLKRINQACDELERATKSATREVNAAKELATLEIRKLANTVRKGMECDTCGRNVYAATNFVHSEYKAYCIDPCWEEHKKGKL